MSVKTLRNRNAAGAITALDLTSADAANRRLDVVLGAKGADKAGTRFVGFEWTKTTSQVVTVTVSKIDTLDGNKEVVIETRSDGGACSASPRATYKAV